MSAFRSAERGSRRGQPSSGPGGAVPQPASHRLLELQRTAGNRAVAHLVQVPPVVVARSSAATGASGQAWQRLGSTGAEVTQIQEGLNSIGTEGTPMPVTGRFDGATDRVVRNFQRDSGIGVDGIVGPHTWEALDRHLDATPEEVSVGPDHHEGIERPTGEQLANIRSSLNPTSSGGGTEVDWDGRTDPVKRQELKDALLEALAEHLNRVTPHMQAREQAKAAGNVLATTDQEGAGRGAKRYVDDLFGDVASAAVLTQSQEQARAAFQFQSGVNLLDASDPNVRPPRPADLAEWMMDTGEQAQEVQSEHGFNRRRTTQGEPAFFVEVRDEFIARGSNLADLERYDLFGFAFAQAGPRVLSQIAIVGDDDFSDERGQQGQMSEAERRQRWSTWETLVHEYLHTLAHPTFNTAAGGNRILTEGFCELFTKLVLLLGGGIARAQADSDRALRLEVEGGDVPGFEARFVPAYNPGEYAGYLARSEEIVAEVGFAAVRSAFFLGHIENIGLKPDGSMIDPTAPDAEQHLAPQTVRIPATITSVTGVSILTGAHETDILDANPGLVPGAPLPAAAYTDGLVVPGTSHHRAIAARSRTEAAVETKAQIASQHGTTEDALVRANPALNHRQPQEGEWVLIPVH